jgi:hypothetical protein
MVKMIHVTLDDRELARLERILAIDDLEAQRRIAYPFWILAVLSLASGTGCVIFGMFAGQPLASFAGFAITALGFGSQMIGSARYGYYRMFRMVHYLAKDSIPTSV